MTEATLSDRDRKILGAVVQEYIHTAEPVGSRCLTKKYGLGVSPATVRNVMADLEDMGYLVQPHTSAGRKPTDRGYRFFVDYLMGVETLAPGERRRLRRQLGGSSRGDIEELLGSTSRALTSAAGQVGVVVAPRFEARVLQHIDFVLLRPGLVLVVLVSRSGVVDHHPVEAQEIGSQAELDRMANYLNEVLENAPLAEVKDRMRREMAREKILYDDLMRRALQLGTLAFADQRTEGGLFFGDPAALLDQPEFAGVSRLKSIFEAFEKKGLILTLLDRATEAPGIRVVIGEEIPLDDLRDLSVVVANYGSGDRVLGSLGIIGPTRMDYGRIVGLVDYTARLLGEVMESL